jgi:phage-related protein
MGVLSPILSVGLAPLLAILGAIASVIYFVGENWETVVSWFQPGIDSIMEGVEELKGAWENLQPFIQAVMPLLQAIATVVGGAIVGALSILFRVASWVFKQIASFINWVAGLLGDLGNTIQWLADGLSGLLGKAAELLGYKGKLNGMNADITNKWMSQGSGGNNNTVTQNNSFTFTNPNQYAPVAQNLGNGLISQFD